jgi:4-hydroxybenzoate polyprenyltransferase
VRIQEDEGIMLQQVRHTLEMIRFSHTVFALPFALLSAALAWHTKPEGLQLIELLGIVLCMVFARSAAMAFNRLADRHLDAANPRTANRHLPRGVLSVQAVWVFTTICAGGFVASTALFLLAEPPNPWPLCLAGPILVFLCGYSYSKRFTALAHFWLGAALMLAPLAAWIAVRGPEELMVPLVLGLAVLFWVAGFDILYACQDVGFDRQARLASVPASLGVPAALRVALLCHLVMVAVLVGLWWTAAPPLGWIYLGGVGAIALLLAYEHYLVRPDDLSRVNQAFFHVNAVISLGLLLVVLLQLWVGP